MWPDGHRPYRVIYLNLLWELGGSSAERWGRAGVCEPLEPDEFRCTSLQTRRTCPALWKQILQAICAYYMEKHRRTPFPSPPHHFPLLFPYPIGSPLVQDPIESCLYFHKLFTDLESLDCPVCWCACLRGLALPSNLHFPILAAH